MPLIPRSWRPRLAVADNFCYIVGEIGVEDRGFAGFLFVLASEGDALGDSPAAREFGSKDGGGKGSVFNDDFGTGARLGEQRGQVAGCFGFRDVDGGHGDYDNAPMDGYCGC